MGSIGNVLRSLLGKATKVESHQRIGGGCISDAARVIAQIDGMPVELFLKSNEVSFLDNFECEAMGLAHLAAADAIRIPNVIAVGIVDGRAWFISEWIEQGTSSPRFYEKFGRELAGLHRATSGDQIGWDRDNYLGAARQINTVSSALSSSDWTDFVVDHRIGFQLRWALDQGLADQRLQRDVEAVMGRMSDLLSGRERSASLLHGDLWSGNYLCDSNGDPVIIDPAVYRGCREAEFGMIRLFGACPASFEEAYHDAFPLPDGWQRRVSVYVLYHLLNHLNLFGHGYHSQCQRTASEILRTK